MYRAFSFTHLSPSLRFSSQRTSCLSSIKTAPSAVWCLGWKRGAVHSKNSKVHETGENRKRRDQMNAEEAVYCELAATIFVGYAKMHAVWKWRLCDSTILDNTFSPKEIQEILWPRHQEFHRNMAKESEKKKRKNKFKFQIILGINS